MTKECARCKQHRPTDLFSGFKTCDPCRAQRRRYRASYNRPVRRRGQTNRTPHVVCGRRFCSDCKRWKHVVDFGVQVWHDPIERTQPKIFRNVCHHCERLRGRVKNARLAGRSEPYGQRRPGMSKEERYRRHNERQKERLRNDPEYAALFRERQRTWAAAKRRAAGVAPRKLAPVAEVRTLVKNDIKLSLEPFQEWVKTRSRFYAMREGLVGIGREGDVEGIAYLANQCGIADRTLRRYLDGYELRKDGSKRILDGVPFGTVDHCLTNEGSTFLWELYPETDDEELLAA